MSLSIHQTSDAGARMHALAAELFPVCRSITGDGLRATLGRLQHEIPLVLREVPSGAQVLDWTIPLEWNIRDAFVADARGRRVVDFAASNLHVVNYSVPLRSRMKLAELRPHLHTLAGQPGWVPYRTSYYKPAWGFCLAHHVLEEMDEDEYDVCIDSTLAPGSLTYGEFLVPGETADEFLFSAHCCHPSLANDNLSGMVVAVELARRLMRRPSRRLSYRFLFAPGTIGAIAWLAANRENVRSIKHGLVLTCVGDRAPFTYKRSRRGDAPIDRLMAKVLRDREQAHRSIDFSPQGYDERQFCSPGFNLPIGCLMRSQHGTFPEYHTSADNLSFIAPGNLAESLALLEAVVDEAETSRPSLARQDFLPTSFIPQSAIRNSQSLEHILPTTILLNLRPFGEPQLGKYGFYEVFGADPLPALWLLNLADGGHTVGAIAERAGLPVDSVAKSGEVLAKLGLVREVSA